MLDKLNKIANLLLKSVGILYIFWMVGYITDITKRYFDLVSSFTSDSKDTIDVPDFMKE